MAPDGHIYTTEELDAFKPIDREPHRNPARVRRVKQSRLDRIMKAHGSEALTRAEAIKLSRLPRKKRREALGNMRRR